MEFSKVSNEDGRRCANLLNFLKNGRWELTGADAEELVRVKRWVHDLALGMAQQLKGNPEKEGPAAPLAPDPGVMRVKSIKPMPKSKKK